MHYKSGHEFAPISTGPYTSSHLVRWCAAQQNWDKIHYDVDFARTHGRLSERVINGALKQHLLVRFLVDAFDDRARIIRLNYKFEGPDFVGEELMIGGRLSRVEERGQTLIGHVELEVRNLTRAKLTTTATAAVLLRGDRELLAEGDWTGALPEWILDENVQQPEGPVPANLADAVDHNVEQVASKYPLDLSRLRLFADAVGGLRAYHFDPDAGKRSRYGTVVGPHLFPIHALEALPGSLPLSTRAGAMGREGVNEVGRDFARLFGFSSSGMVNGGSDAEIHSLVCLGETVVASSRLLSAKVKSGSRGGNMLLTVALNTYTTSSGRLLLREKQVTIILGFRDTAVPEP